MLADACKQLFEDVVSLELENVFCHCNLVPSLEFGQWRFNKLTSLYLKGCSDMKCLIDASKQQVPTTAFSNLIKLSLRDMFGLEELCNGPQPQGFLQKLKTLFIRNCKEMIGAIPIIQNLEELEVEDCDKMQVLFQSVQQGSSHHLSLQSLKVIEIKRCNSLRYLFPKSVANSLGQLQTLTIVSCSQLEEIIQATQVSNIRLHGLRLENLTKPKISNCPQLEYTFPISMIEGLPLLNEVELIYLPELKGNDIVLTLPSLQKLKVDKCTQLTHFIISAKTQVRFF